MEEEGTATPAINEIPGTSKEKPQQYAVRRGSRQRPKPDFFGNNMMVVNVETPGKEQQAKGLDKEAE